MHVINYLLADDVIYTIQKKGSHQLQIDLRSYDLILDQGEFLIATIKKFKGDIHIQTAEAIKNPSSIKVAGTYKMDSLGNKNMRFEKCVSCEYFIKVRVQLERTN